MRASLCLVVLTLAAAACGETDVDAAGDYSIALTNRDNGCEFTDWTEGNTSQNIPFVITQDGSEVTGTVEGLSGTFLALWLGTNVFHGEVGGSSIEMTAFGTRSLAQGNCAYTINATVDASLDGDLLEGSIVYTAATNGNPDCSTLDGCESTQDFNGTRPPQ